LPSLSRTLKLIHISTRQSTLFTFADLPNPVTLRASINLAQTFYLAKQTVHGHDRLAVADVAEAAHAAFVGKSREQHSLVRGCQIQIAAVAKERPAQTLAVGLSQAQTQTEHDFSRHC
jgi:hypothetical protein